MSYTIRVDQVMDRSLVAAMSVPYKRLPVDADAPVGYFAPGSLVGVVAAFIISSPPRNANLYWMFRTHDGKAYYVEHRAEYFDIDHLLAQGVLTEQERREAQRVADQSVFQRGLETAGGIITETGELLKNNFGTIVKFAGFGIIAFFAIKALR